MLTHCDDSLHCDGWRGALAIERRALVDEQVLRGSANRACNIDFAWWRCLSGALGLHDWLARDHQIGRGWVAGPADDNIALAHSHAECKRWLISGGEFAETLSDAPSGIYSSH